MHTAGHNEEAQPQRSNQVSAGRHQEPVAGNEVRNVANNQTPLNATPGNLPSPGVGEEVKDTVGPESEVFPPVVSETVPTVAAPIPQTIVVDGKTVPNPAYTASVEANTGLTPVSGESLRRRRIGMKERPALRKLNALGERNINEFGENIDTQPEETVITVKTDQGTPGVPFVPKSRRKDHQEETTNR